MAAAHPTMKALRNAAAHCADALFSCANGITITPDAVLASVSFAVEETAVPVRTAVTGTGPVMCASA